MKSILICTVFSIFSFGTFANNVVIKDPVNVSVSPLIKIDISINCGGVLIHIIGDLEFDVSGHTIFNGTISVGGQVFPIHYNGSVAKSMGKYENQYDKSSVEKEYLEFVEMVMSNLYLPIDYEKVSFSLPGAEPGIK